VSSLGIRLNVYAHSRAAVKPRLGSGVYWVASRYVILFGFRKRPQRPGIAIRLGALAAFTVAFVSLIFEILPLGDVASPALFALKVGGTICAVNGFGA